MSADIPVKAYPGSDTHIVLQVDAGGNSWFLRLPNEQAEQLAHDLLRKVHIKDEHVRAWLLTLWNIDLNIVDNLTPAHRRELLYVLRKGDKYAQRN